MSQAQLLSSKERSLFQQVVKFYESKQYKKGIKAADQILRKTSNHGDTQAMKALLLNSIGDREEAFTLAKLALKNDMKSHVCWHVYGLLWRSVKNFDEAIKAYKFALRLQPESQQIIRDLAMLQVQMRDYEGYVQSRKTMLQQRPQMRQNWTAMAIAHHLAGDLKAAEQVLTKYEETMTGKPSAKDIEHSEAVLYKNTIIAEMGETERALEHLETVRKTNLDKTAVMEMRAKYLLQLGRKEEAEKAYRQLLDRNSEFRAYYAGLEEALGLDPNDKQARKELYAEYAEKNVKLDAARRIPLDFLDGDDFREAADHYLRRMLTKGVPSTFNNVKALYNDPSKLQIITELVEGYKTPQTNGHSDTNGDKPDLFETSTNYFLAQHYNYKLSRDLSKATSYIDQLIEQSPKTYDYVMIKARILKHSGDVVEAAKTMNAARELDLKDRYINTKCAKYQLRANDNAAAIHTMSLFTRNETLGGALGDLVDMQSLIYLTEDGEAFARQRKFGPALKRFNAVADVFDVWNEDQFDFHTFSLRKGQIRAYIDMIRWEDTLHAHPFYTRAAVDAIKVYIAMSDNSALASPSYIRGLTHMTQEEQTAAKKQQNQERIKQNKLDNEQREADKKILAKKANAAADGEVKKSDEDPQGTKFLETKEPLMAAMRFLTPLLEVGEKSFESQICGFEVYLRREKYRLALKHLLTAIRLDSSSPLCRSAALRLRYAISTSSTASTDADLLDLVNTSLPAPYNDDKASLSTLNNDYLSSNKDSPAAVFACIRAQRAIEKDASSDDATMKVLGVVRNGKDVTVEDALQGLLVLDEVDVSPQKRAEYIDACCEKFSIARSLLERGAF